MPVLEMWEGIHAQRESDQPLPVTTPIQRVVARRGPVKTIHARIEAAVGHGSHTEATQALLALAVADNEAAFLREEEEKITGDFRRALQRVLSAIVHLTEHPNKRRRTPDGAILPLVSLPELRPRVLPALEASEFLLRDTTLTNSAITAAVRQLRGGRYHPSVVLYTAAVDTDWSETACQVSLYTWDLLLQEWSHTVQSGHFFTFLHVLQRMQLTFSVRAVQSQLFPERLLLRAAAPSLDRDLYDVIRAKISEEQVSQIKPVPVFPNREWGSLWLQFVSDPANMRMGQYVARTTVSGVWRPCTPLGIHPTRDWQRLLAFDGWLQTLEAGLSVSYRRFPTLYAWPACLRRMAVEFVQASVRSLRVIPSPSSPLLETTNLVDWLALVRRTP